MQLIYLYIENYKNIKNEGFNFTTQFKCDYTDGTLTIAKNENYIENFFGDNIEVSAIVGENGSGKSSVLDILHKGLNDFDFRGFALFKNIENEILYLQCTHKEYDCLEQYKNLYDDKSKVEFPLFNYSFTYDIYANSSSRLSFPEKYYRTINGIINLKNELIKNQKNILLNYFELKKNNQLGKFDKFFIPKTINIFLNYSNIENFYQKKQTKDTKETLSRLMAQVKESKPLEDLFSILKDITELLNDKNSYEKPKNEFDFFNPSFELGNNDEENIHYNLWCEDYLSKIDIKQYSNNQIVEVINHNSTWLDDLRLKVLSFNIDKLNEEIIKVILASFSSDFFVIQLCDTNDKKLNDLSYGEQQLLFVLNQIYALSYYSPVVDEVVPHFDIDNFIVLLDEIELGFHPNWQKNIIGYFLDFLLLIPNKKFHLIFSSHSPFILSDVPKQNIVFLKDGKQVDALEKKQTFGANIHTLLADGFFMDGGLMGEFAKEKIEEVIKFLNSDKSKIKDKKDVLNIIDIIGEPFLKQKLKDMYFKKFNDNSIDEQIKKLELEIERLKNVKS